MPSHSSYGHPIPHIARRVSPSHLSCLLSSPAKSNLRWDTPTWVGMTKDSLLRAARDKQVLASATMGGSCPHPDQSWNWLVALRASDLWIEASSPILLFFIMGGVAPTCCSWSDGLLRWFPRCPESLRGRYLSTNNQSATRQRMPQVETGGSEQC